MLIFGDFVQIQSPVLVILLTDVHKPLHHCPLLLAASNNEKIEVESESIKRHMNDMLTRSRGQFLFRQLQFYKDAVK